MASKLAPLKSPKPTARPGVAGSTRSPRPTLRPLPEKVRMEALGDVEFEADLKASGSQDPISKLGFTRGKPTTLGTRADEGTSRQETGEVRVGFGYNAPAVWNHEFRHLGLHMLVDEVNRVGVSDIDKKYGPGVVNALRSRFGEELVELFDRPDDYAGPLMGTMEKTLDHDSTWSPEKEVFAKALTTMALDILETKGVPPPAQKRETHGQKVKRVQRYSEAETKEARSWIERLLGIGD